MVQVSTSISLSIGFLRVVAENTGGTNSQELGALPLDCDNRVMTKLRGPRLKPVRCPHGHSRRGKRTRTFRSWSSMIDRCTNPSTTHYQYYGGRGITVCERWRQSFLNFLEDMGECPPGLTLDRLEQNGNYCKDNCAWRSRLHQSRNRRSAVTVEYQGRTMCLSEACELAGVPYMRTRKRMRLGWSLEDAMHTPALPQGKRRAVLN